MELDFHLLKKANIREDFLKEEGELVNMWNKYRITLFSGNENKIDFKKTIIRFILSIFDN